MAGPQTTSGGPRRPGSSRTGECTGRGAPTRTGGRPGSCSVAASWPGPRLHVYQHCQEVSDGQQGVNLGNGDQFGVRLLADYRTVAGHHLDMLGVYEPLGRVVMRGSAADLGLAHGRRPAARSSRPRTWTRAQLVDGRHPSNTSPTRLIGAVSSAPTKVDSPSTGAPGGAAGAIWGARTDALMAASSAAHASASGSSSTGAGAAAAYRVPSNRRPRHAL